MTTPTRPLSGRRAGALATALCISGALLLSGCSKSPAQIEKKDYGLGEHYLSEGKVNEAIIEFQNVLKVNPKSVKGRLGLADAYMKKGWTTQAVLEYREVSKEDPLSLPAHLAMARYGVNSGQWTAVEPEIAAVLKIDPNNVEGLTFEGERQLALGHQKEAEDNFRKALALSPGSVPALVGMGDLFRKENLADKASSFYQQALAKDPSNGRALTGLGYLAQTQGKTDEAKENFQKAMEADKGDLRSRIIYTNFLAGQGKVQEAIDLLKAVPKKAADLRIPVKIAEYEVLLGQNAKAIALMRPLELQKIALPDIYLVLAKAYQNTGRIPEALNEATKLSVMEGLSPIMKIEAARIELAGRNPGKARDILMSLKNVSSLPSVYWLSLGEAETAQSGPSRGAKVYSQGLALYPGDPRLLLAFSDTQVVLKKYGEAKRALDQLLEADPQSPLYHSRMGVLIARTRGVSAEIAYQKSAAGKYPDNEALESLYLVTLSANKKLPEAIGEGEAYLKSHPSEQNIRLLLADFDLQAGKQRKAMDLYRQILSVDPKNVQALTDLANLEFRQKKYAEAESYDRRALREVPDNPNLETALGETLLAENQKEPAMQAFRKALELNPNQPLALLELGRAEVLSGDARGALTHLAPLVKAPFPKPQQAQIQWLWGLANQSAGNDQVALDGLQKAVSLDPGVASYRETLGEFWSNRSRWDKALPELEKSQSLDPKNALLALEIAWGKVKTSKGTPDTAQLERVVRRASDYERSHPNDLRSALIEAQADLLLKKNDRALAVYDRLLASQPSNAALLYGKAALLLGNGKVDEARKLVRKLLADHPNNLGANLLMAQIDQRKNNVRGMVDHLERVHRTLPSAVEPALALAQADLSLGRFEEAKSVAFSLYEGHPGLYQALYLKASAEMGLKEYRHAVRDFVTLSRHDKNPGAMLNMASVAAGKMGDEAASRQYLDKAFRSDPGNPSVLNNLAFSLAERNADLPRALDLARKALAKADTPDVQDTLGYVLYRMRRFDQAQPHFESAYKANFRDPEFLFHMGLNESKLGQKDRARELLEKALTSGDLSPEERSEAHKVLG
uniref:Probable TPR-domain containing protein n=1 Tax=Leptospirillum ferrodiazotrophum TaxID=412449 RepID=C6HYQ2_9BACT|nr:MAG: probable TPR-domain containing protein [Leptospirillum ferrodiazotrophum]